MSMQNICEFKSVPRVAIPKIQYGDFETLLGWLNNGDQSKEARIWKNANRNFRQMIWSLAKDRFPHKVVPYQFGQDFDTYPKAVRETLKEAIRELSILTLHEFAKGGECSSDQGPQVLRA